MLFNFAFVIFLVGFVVELGGLVDVKAGLQSDFPTIWA